MNELIDVLGRGNAAIVGGLATALLVLATLLPKLVNGIKGDKIDGGLLDRIERNEKRMDRMDDQIHKQQVHITRLQVLVIQMNGLLTQNGIVLPAYMQAEIAELTEEEEEGPP